MVKFIAIHMKNLIGKSLEEVQKILKDKPVRVMEIDGVQYFGTMDYVPERCNLKVEKGIVTDITNG